MGPYLKPFDYYPPSYYEAPSQKQKKEQLEKASAHTQHLSPLTLEVVIKFKPNSPDLGKQFCEKVHALWERSISPNIKAATKLKEFRPDFSALISEMQAKNTKSYDEFQAKRCALSKTLSESEQAVNYWHEADKMVSKLAAEKTPITLEIIQQLNAAESSFRTCLAATGGGYVGKTYLPGICVQEEMEGYVKWLNQELAANNDDNAVIVAAQAIQRFVSIHPFTDGNGRVGRFLMDYVLQRAGLPPAILSTSNVALFATQEDNVNQHLSIVLVKEGVLNSCKHLKLCADCLPFA